MPWRVRGIAMVTVLWFVAAMSLLVAGIVGSARTDVRMAQFHLQEAEGTAAADGAIRLFLADYVDGRFQTERPTLARGRYRVGDVDVFIVAVPASQLVNPNAAPVPLLRAAFEAAGAGDAGAELARAVVSYREAPGKNRRLAGGGAFPVPEALLQVPGLGRGVWDRLRDFVSAGSGGSGRGGGRGDEGAGQAIGILRDLAPAARAGREAFDPGAMALGPNWRPGGTLRVDAMFRRGGRSWLRRRWERIGVRGSTGLPWTTERVEGTRIMSGTG